MGRILKLLNQRDLEALKEKWWNNNPNKKDCPKAEDESDGISIQNIGGVFIVILVGIALSIVTLAFEYWSLLPPPRTMELACALRYYKDKPRKGLDGRNGNVAIGSSNIATIQVQLRTLGFEQRGARRAAGGGEQQ